MDGAGGSALMPADCWVRETVMLARGMLCGTLVSVSCHSKSATWPLSWSTCKGGSSHASIRLQSKKFSTCRSWAQHSCQDMIS